MAVNIYSLCTLSEVKEFMGMTGSISETDDFLEDTINRVSALFESLMHRNILSRQYTEYSNGEGLLVLFPRQGPITEITSIYDDSTWEWAESTLIDSTTYRTIDNDYIVFYSIMLGNYKQNVKLTYTAGYTTTPEDLKLAAITEVVRIYKNKNQVDITAQKLGDGSVSYSAKTLLPLTITTLNNYKRAVIV